VNGYAAIERLLIEQPEGWWDDLVKFLPELELMADTPQSSYYHAEGDVAIHTRLAVEACPANSDPDLPWAALLHDLGKPLTTELHEEGIHSRGHDRAGAKLAAELLERLGMPEGRRRRIAWAVRHHTFHLAWQLTSPGQASKQHRNFVTHKDFPLLLALLRADSLASLGHPQKMDAYNLYLELWQDLTGQREEP
jgi:putative nucleotidyltransferase with HDIG domain